MPLDQIQTEQLAVLRMISANSPGQLNGTGIGEIALKTLYETGCIRGKLAAEEKEYSILGASITPAGYRYKEDLERQSA